MEILLFQADIPPGLDRAAREARVRQLCERLGAELEGLKRRPSLAVLPELCTVEYSDEAFNNLPEVAEDVHGASFQEFSAIAKCYDVAISFSLPIAENGRTYISNLVIGSDGEILSRYDKVHLAQLGASHEKRYFSPGDRLSVFTLGDCRFGVLLCYDFRFPAFVQAMCTSGELDVLLHPVAFTRDETFASWHHFVITRALENQVYVLSLNRAGTDWGNSIVCPPWVDSEHQAERLGLGEECRLVTTDRQLITAVRERIPLRADRLADYRNLD